MVRLWDGGLVDAFDVLNSCAAAVETLKGNG